MAEVVAFAFDRSMRRRDVDGRLHVEKSHISKAMVCPYLGSEIPNAAALGLDANKVYYLLRDPEELRKGAPTFRNLPILIQHVPVTADRPRQDLVVGTTGSEVTFDGTYLDTSLAIWTAEAIAGVESEEQTELSSAYRYRADMTPGTFHGVPYDGVMRDLIGNHVALVEVGRAGSDVVVADSLPLFLKEKYDMKLSAKAKIIAAALTNYLTPLVAQDAAADPLLALIGNTPAMAFDAQVPLLAAGVRKEYGNKLVAGANLDGVEAALQALTATDLVLAQDADPMQMADDEADAEYEDDPDQPGKKRKKVKAAMDKDQNPGDPKAPKSPEGGAPKPAMDADAIDALVNKRVATVVDAAVAAATAATNALNQARADVLPLVGEVALDSAQAVYRFALDQLGVDVTDVHPTAYRSLVTMVKSQGAAKPQPRLAQDSVNTRLATAKAFPQLARFGRL